MNHTIIFQQFLGEVYNQVQGQKIILKSQKAQKKKMITSLLVKIHIPLVPRWFSPRPWT